MKNHQAIIRGNASVNTGGGSSGPGGAMNLPGGSQVNTGALKRFERSAYPVIVRGSGAGAECLIWAGTRYAPVDCITIAITPPGFQTTPPTPPTPQRAVTLADIAHFTPEPPRAIMEPNGWTVQGLPTNFYSSSRAHERQGRLFGLPVTVRFTPIGYRWSYGEGGTATHRVPGGTWASQSLAEFAPTTTSYRYQTLGNYTIRHQVLFLASYRFNGGNWQQIDGSILLPANDLHISVGNLETLLFEKSCQENPAALGCGR
ncbi:MAG: hypothetical protein WBA28_00425 [Microbacteriaceae bacterium]